MKYLYSAVLFVAVFVLLFGCAGGGPQAPTQVSASPTGAGVQVTWAPSASSDVAGYNIYRSNSAGQLGGKLNTAPINDVSFTDANVQDGHTYYYTVRSVGSNGVEGVDSAQITAAAMTKPPSGLSIVIDNGAQFATSDSVTLSISAIGAAQCRFSNDAVAWGDWQAYSASVSWTLSDGDGQKTVYMGCRNAVGVESSPVSASIVLKTTGPDITITAPQQGQTVPARFSLSFKIANAMGEANCNANADGAAMPLGNVVEGKENTLSMLLADGGHALYVECTDEAGTSKSTTVDFETEQNPIKLTINDGSGHTKSTAVNLNVFAQSATQCRFGNDANSLGQWMLYKPVVQWTLTSGSGTKTVYAECRDSSQFSLGVANDTIVLDPNPPSISLTINNGELVTYSRNVKLTTYVSGSVTDCRFSDDGGSVYAGWTPYTMTTWRTLTGGDGSKQVMVQCRDSAGSISTASATIMLQQTAPNPPQSLSIMINGGASRTTSRDVWLSLSARFADNCHYRNENGGWSDWEPYVTSRSWTLSDGQGTKIVFFQCNNQYGSSGVSQAQITYGSDRPPTVSVITPQDGGIYGDSTVQLQFIPDGNSPLSCTYYCNGQPNDAGSVSAGSMVTRTLLTEGQSFGDNCGMPAPGSEFTTAVICTDPGGRTAQSGQITFTWTKWVGPLKEGEGMDAAGPA